MPPYYFCYIKNYKFSCIGFKKNLFLSTLSMPNEVFSFQWIQRSNNDISRSQAPAWERTCRGSPASRDGRRTEAGASGADAFPSRGLGTRKICEIALQPIFFFSRSQAPAWERTCRGGSPASRDGRRTEAGASGADAFPSRGLGTRKNSRFFMHYYSGQVYFRLKIV